ncbi:hypothetical protein RMB03_15630 [Acinetobacter sp. V91_7]|uniref:hypothetical protein n=1 Tax=Acinetobacter TaxID=469 RepID=UPI0012505579|nr:MULTISPECIES: hypothetical protein [Acinetobacter]MDS7936008.1 hypothetical protein [Acinetobacter sp. V91_4B]MDS7964384.1 hypothetical protein [Acinetobacter sp. V91_7]MDS8026305.1 hypothetical protein [Acinetobacter sp. V91_13]MDY7371677.1 hypothetical protein [Acinetobacter oleivorans]
MMVIRSFHKYFVIVLASLLATPLVHAIPFSKADKSAICYLNIHNKSTQPEPCIATFSVLNEDENTAVIVYRKQIFRMSNRTVCESSQAHTCYIENETVAFGRLDKVNDDEYMYLKEEDGLTYFRNQSRNKVSVDKLFKPINDKWATCMKSKSYDICIQSKYSIEKIPKLRNEF